MSSAQRKMMFKDTLAPPPVSSSDEDESDDDGAPVTVGGAFGALTSSGGAASSAGKGKKKKNKKKKKSAAKKPEEKTANAETLAKDVKPEANAPAGPAAPPTAVLVKKKPKKSAASKKAANGKKPKAAKDASTGKPHKKVVHDEFDDVLSEFLPPEQQEGKAKTNAPTKGSDDAVEGPPSALSVDSRLLDSEKELKEVFGAAVAKTMLRSREGRSLVFTRPNPNWPAPRAMLTLKVLGQQADNATAYAFVWTETYAQAEALFENCVASGQPNTLVMLLRNYGFHSGALVQLASLSQKSGQYEQACEMMERALYFFEVCVGNTFRFDDPRVRLPYSVRENQAFHVVLFRWALILGRKGCPRTALECCKVALSLDRTDPLDVLFLMDYFALRSQQYEWVLRCIDESVGVKRVSEYPNFAYARAFALFHLGRKEEARSRLIEALVKFPECAVTIFESLKLSAPWASRGVFTDGSAPPSLSRAVQVYCSRSKDMWRIKALQEWIGKVATDIVEGRVELDAYSEQRSAVCRAYASESAIEKLALPGLVKHVVLVEEDVEGGAGAAQIPAALLQEALNLDELDRPPPPNSDIAMARLMGTDAMLPDLEQQLETLRHAPTANALALFLHSLLPWNAPNAPPTEEEMGWIERAQAILGLDRRGGPNENQRDEDDGAMSDDDRGNQDSSHTDDEN